MKSMDYQGIIEEIIVEVGNHIGQGKVANYIPALAAIPINKFGIALTELSGKEYFAGDAKEAFSLQSVSKVATLTLALKLTGDKLWDSVGREPSGNPFNSLVQLEYEHGLPRNPFINAGSLILVDAIISATSNSKVELLEFVQRYSPKYHIGYDLIVAQSERETGFRNAALANFLKSFDMITNNVEDVLDLYFHHCSLAGDCLSLAHSLAYLANKGTCPWTGDQVVSSHQCRGILSLMLTCGAYDSVGKFAYNVGLPAKSGVGGGIVAIVPGKLVIAVWSPGLDASGNSFVGTKALELFCEKTGFSLFEA